MKKRLSIFLFVFAAGSFFTPFHFAHAITCPPANNPAATQEGADGNCHTLAEMAGSSFGLSPTTSNDLLGPVLNGATAVVNAVTDPVKAAFDWTTGVTIGFLFDQLTNIVNIFSEIAVFLLMLVGLLFNFVVDQLVVHMGSFVTSSSSTGIQTAWQIIRDLANIGIIGGLIAVAIGTILQSGTYNANKFLSRLIIAALLVNFSYYFAGAIIDSSNYLATQFYTNLICGSTDPTCANTTIAGTFQDILNIQAVKSLTTLNVIQSVQAGTNHLALGGIQTFMSSLLFLIMVLVTIFVFLSALALLIGRFVSLIFILIASPVGIAGSAIPGVEKYAKEWWNILFAQAFFAPLYFLFLGFSVIILKNFTHTAAFSSINPSDPTAIIVGTILNFLVATVFMLLSLRIAKQMSEVGKQYLGDIYKGADRVTGWMPKAYTSALKYMGSSAGTYTIGHAGDVLGRQYDALIARNSDKGLGKFLAGGVVDRNIKKGFGTIATAKFGGKESYEDTLKAKQDRKTLLSEEKKFEEAREKEPDLAKRKKKAQDEHDALMAKYGEGGALEKVENKIAQEKFKKNFSDLTDEQKKDVMNHGEWRAGYKELDDAANARFGTGWGSLQDEQRKKLIEQMKKEGKWKGRDWVKQDNGTWGWETGFPYHDRLRRDIDYRDEKDKDADALRVFQRKYNELNKAEKEEIDGKKYQLTLQGSIDNQRTALNEVSWDRIKEEHLRNPGILRTLTPMLSAQQYKEALDDKSISKAEKHEMRNIRLGGIMQEAQKFESNVVDLGKWEEMTKEQRQGKILRGSPEYDAYRWALHEKLKKYYATDEIVDFVESDNGLESDKDTVSMRDNVIFNDAMTNGVYKKLQDSKKISAGEKRAMRSRKRTRGEYANKMDDQAADLFKAHGVNDEPERERLMKNAEDAEGNVISFDEYETKFKELGGKGSREGDLFRAAWLRKRAEAAAKKYYDGKAPDEIASEMKQEAFGTRLAGKYMSKDQLRASGGKDQKYQNDEAVAMAVHGDIEKIKWLKYQSDGQNYQVDWDRVDRERKAAGLKTISEALEEDEGVSGSAKTIPVPQEESVQDIVTNIAQRNAAAVGTKAAAPNAVERLQENEVRIRKVLSEPPVPHEGIENIIPKTDDALDIVVDDMRPADLADLPPDILEQPRFAAAIHPIQAASLLSENVISPRTRRILIDNIKKNNKKPEMQEWIQSDEGKKLIR